MDTEARSFVKMTKPACFMKSCKTRSGWFHCLPFGARNEKRRNVWLHRMGRNISEFHIFNNAYCEGTTEATRVKVKLCEKHFSDDQFQSTRNESTGLRKLKPSAIPDLQLDELAFDPSSYVEVQMKPLKDPAMTKLPKSQSNTGAKSLKTKKGTVSCVSSEHPDSSTSQQKIIFFPNRDKNSQMCNVVIRSEVNIPQTSSSSPKVKKITLSQLSKPEPSSAQSKPATVTKLNELSFGTNITSQSKGPNIPSLTIAKPKVTLIKKTSQNDEVCTQDKLTPLKNVNMENVSLLKRNVPVADYDVLAKRQRLLAPKPYIPVSLMCRLCAENEAPMVEILSNKGQQLGLTQKIALCFPFIQLDQAGRLPLRVCTSCLPKLDICYDIVHSCNDANKKLAKLLQTEEQEDLARKNPIPLILIENNIADDALTDDPKRMCVVREKFVHVDKNLPAPEQIAQVLETVKAGLGTDRHNVSMSSLYNTLTYQKLQQQSSSTSVTSDSPFKCTACEENLPDYFTLIQHQLLKFSCRLCHTRFCSHKSRLAHHRVVHKDRSDYNCSKCKMTFSKKELYEDHKLKIHYVECHCCSKTFTSKLSLIAHLKQEIMKKLFKCKKCKTKFTNSKDYDQHVKSNSCAALNFFPCLTCGKEFHSSCRHQKHQESHMPQVEIKKKFECEVCHKRFMFRRKLAVHMMFHTGEKALHCNLCSKGFVTSGQYNYHMEVHANERKYECDICKSKFLHRVHLVKHMRNKHLYGIQYKCEVCRDVFALKEEVLRHLELHAPIDKYKLATLFTQVTPYKCDICGKCLVYKDSYTSHMKRHKDKESGISYMCEICGKNFASPKGLKNHSKRHIGNDGTATKSARKPRSTPTPMPETLKRYECHQCHKKFSTTVQVLAHMASHTGIKPFQCSLCDSTFTTKANKNLHELKHKGIKNFVCEHCNKPFYNQYSLVQHMRSHTREKPYKCNICEKAFPRRPNLTAHLRTHSGERPYSCDICNQTFTQKTSRDKHMTLHTKEKFYKCEMCDFGSNRKKELNDHSLAQHRIVFVERNFVKPVLFQDDNVEEMQEAHYQIQIIEQDEQEVVYE